MKEKALKLLKSKFFLSLVINSVIIVFCICASTFSYDNSEDFYNSLYICKFHFYYSNKINYILALIIGSVQYVLPNFNCYVLAQVLLSFLGFTSFTYVAIDKFGKSKALVFTVILNTLFALHHYADIEYHKTAALLLAAGFLLVLNAIRNKRYNLPCWVGVAEILLGSFFCFKYFFVALAFALAYFFAELIVRGKYKIKFRKFFWFFRPYLLLFVFITFLAMGGSWYSYSVNHSSDEASTYYEYSQLTDSINSLSYPNYKEHIEEFNAIGIYENEYKLLKSGYYDPNNSLNNTALSLVASIQQEENVASIPGAAFGILSDIGGHFAVFDCYVLIILVFAAIVVTYIIFQKKKFIFFPIFYLVTAVAASTAVRYFYTDTDSLVYGIWLLLYMFLIFSFDFKEHNPPKKPSFMNMRRGPVFISGVLSICLFLSYCIVYQANLPSASSNKKPSSLYSEIDRHPERYYVLDPLTSEDYMKYTDNYTHPLWGFRSSFLSNVDYFGYYKSTDKLLSYNLSANIYEAVLSNNQIYVIDNYITYRKENYLEEHYAEEGANVVYKQVNEISKYKIYEVVTE